MHIKVLTLFDIIKKVVDVREKFDEKVAFLSTFSSNQRQLKTFPKSYVLLKENLYSYMTGYAIERNHFLYELVDEIVQRLVTGGVLEYSIQYYLYADLLSFNVYHHLDYLEESKVLTVKDLSYGFTLWIAACFLSYLVFLLELTTFYIKMNPIYHFKNFIGLLGLLNALNVCNEIHFSGLGINAFQPKSSKIKTQKKLAWSSTEDIINTPNIERNVKYMTCLGKIFFGKVIQL